MADDAELHIANSPAKDLRNYNISQTESIDFSKPIHTIDTSNLQGRTAIVTGGACGIGLAATTALAERGSFVAILDWNEEAGIARESELKEEGLKVKFIKCNVTDWASQLAAFKETIRLSGNQLDIVIPCAGLNNTDTRLAMLPDGHIAGDDPPEPPMKTLEVNFIGVYYTTILAGHYFLTLAEHRSNSSFKPQLLYVSSLAGYLGAPGGLDYCGAKWGVRGFFKALRDTLDSPNAHPLSRSNAIGMQVNLIAPTYLQTSMTEAAVPALEKMGCRVGTVDDAAAAVLRCVCDPKVDGRAVAIAQGYKVPGDANFDLNDDLPDGDAGPTFYKAVQSGVFGPVLNFG